MLVKTFGSAVYGINATTITVEVNQSSGINFILVGLPDNAVKESQKRIVAALKNCSLNYPRVEITVNMAPADIRKEGSSYDLTIALGILAGSGQVQQDALEKYVIMGEMSLDGGVQAIKGVLPIAIQAYKEGFKGIILPKANAREAAIVNGLDVYGVENIMEVVELLNGGRVLEPVFVDAEEEFRNSQGKSEFDFSDVKGQENIKRAMEVAAAGGHNIILIPPVRKDHAGDDCQQFFHRSHWVKHWRQQNSFCCR
jgi:magnesium chelatase family protein